MPNNITGSFQSIILDLLDKEKYPNISIYAEALNQLKENVIKPTKCEYLIKKYDAVIPCFNGNLSKNEAESFFINYIIPITMYAMQGGHRDKAMCVYNDLLDELSKKMESLQKDTEEEKHILVKKEVA